MENYYVKENKKGYSDKEEDRHRNYGSSSSSSKNLEAINFMSLNGKDKNDWPPSNEMEHMFDKVVTPSDVGKLNRLVIPKQHAEKYFPLDASANEKGLFLNFRDRIGKPWRFRYSYWNSSQSYVMTKGWSRFVKDKKLDPGDVVSFIRSVRDSNVMYIDWRRRLPPPQAPLWGGRFYATTTPLMAIPHFRVNPYRFHRQYYHHGGIRPAVVIDSVPLAKHHHHQYVKTMRPTKSNKQLRLFGVNMELSSTTTTMQEEDDESDQQCQILSSRVASLPPPHHHLASSSPSTSHHQQALELRLPNLWS